MAKMEALLQDGLRSELILKQRLKTLSETLRQQLQETESKQQQELERRIHQNSLLSPDSDQESTNEVKYQAKHVGMRRSASTSALSSHPGHSKFSSPACDLSAFSTTAQQIKEDEAECLKKFSARPVPGHVTQPLYREMMELREEERKRCLQQRRDFLLSIQKPFSFQEREREKREKMMMTMLEQLASKNKTKPPHNEVKNSSDLTDHEVCRQVSPQKTSGNPNPTVSVSPKLHTAERNRKQKLDFLDQRPSFRPKITDRVPDFGRIHRKLQTTELRKNQSKDGVKCQPFNLRTSALPERRSKKSPENSQTPKIKSEIKRSKSLGTLTSLSENTLPTYITDAVRKRCNAIRKSLELRESQNLESSSWLESYRLKTHSMKKTVASHARLLEPQCTLGNGDRVQRYRKAERQRMRDYSRELQDMKTRVEQRPLLFEQVTQKSAKARAEQTYRNKLQNAGLKEQFVEETGRKSSSSSSSSSSSENKTREENVDDGEKI